MFEAKLPARQFRKYVCVGRHASDEKIVGEKDGVEVRENEKDVGASTIERIG
jgi:SP family sugar:H+ symporter-like MFS transporter